MLFNNAQYALQETIHWTGKSVHVSSITQAQLHPYSINLHKSIAARCKRSSLVSNSNTHLL